MLGKAARISNGDDFRRTTRRGVRIGRPTLVLHAASAPGHQVRVGFIVSKAVGNAVTRNRVKRRLRHLVAAELSSPAVGTDVVIRALPRAAVYPAEVTRDVPAAWSAAMRRLGECAGEG